MECEKYGDYIYAAVLSFAVSNYLKFNKPQTPEKHR